MSIYYLNYQHTDLKIQAHTKVMFYDPHEKCVGVFLCRSSLLAFSQFLLSYSGYWQYAGVRTRKTQQLVSLYSLHYSPLLCTCLCYRHIFRLCQQNTDFHINQMIQHLPAGLCGGVRMCKHVHLCLKTWPQRNNGQVKCYKSDLQFCHATECCDCNKQWQKQLI